jgi:hypothetical protein
MALRNRLPRITAFADQAISCNLIPSGETFFNASVTNQAFISTTLIASSEQFFLAAVSTGAVNVNCNLVPSSETFYPLVVFQDDKIINTNLLASTLTFPLLEITGGITYVDTSDILDKRIRKARKKRKQDELDEENVAAQILKARQSGKEPLKPESRKPFEIKIKQQLATEAAPAEIIEAISEPEYVFSESQKQEITDLIQQYQSQQKALRKQRQIRALMMLAIEDFDS